MASTLGFTRIDIGAWIPRSLAIFSISFNSEADSILKQWIPYSSAFLIEDLVLATPENTQRFDFPPAAITLSSSPIETTSKPEPSFAKIFKTAKFEFALTA